MPPPSWSTPEVIEAIREFCAANPTNNEGVRIREMLLRKYHIVVNKSMLAGVLFRAKIDRGYKPRGITRGPEEIACSTMRHPKMFTEHGQKQENAIAHRSSIGNNPKNRSHHKPKAMPEEPTVVYQPIPESIDGPLEFAAPLNPASLDGRDLSSQTSDFDQKLKSVRPVTMPSHVKRALEAAQRDRNHISPFDNVAYRPVVRSAPTSMRVIGYARTCQWIEQDKFCDAPSEPSRSYCEDHCRRVYTNYRRIAA